jgi:hypothetical protein
MAVTRFTCPACHGVLRLANPVAPGKRIRCPKCAEVVIVPEPEEEEALAIAPAPNTAAKAKSARPIPEERDENDEDSARPRQRRRARKKGNQVLLWSLVGSGVLVLGVIALVVYLLTRPPASDSKKPDSDKDAGPTEIELPPDVRKAAVGLAETLKTPEEVWRHQVIVKREMKALLAAVKDEKTARAVAPRVAKLVQEDGACHLRFGQLGGEIVGEQGGELAARLTKAQNEIREEKKRLSKIPGISEIIPSVR